MPSKDIEFAEYAQNFYKIIEGEKGHKAVFTRALLKMGLRSYGKKILDDLFPTINTEKSGAFIEKKASDRLRKYLRDDNGIGDIADEIYAALDKELYCEELKEYEESRIIEFAKSLQLDTDFENIEEVRKAIADCYYSIIERASASKSSEVSKTSGSQDIILSYTITEDEKKALLRLCELIKTSLSLIKSYTDRIYNKQDNLSKLSDSEEDAGEKSYLEDQIDSLKKRFYENYSKLEQMCSEIVVLLKSKKIINTNLDKIISIAKNINRDEYKITMPGKFKYNSFAVMISSFNDSYNRLLRDIDKI